MAHVREWYPIESSPEMFTSMARVRSSSLPELTEQTWGLPQGYSFVDVFGLDGDLLSLRRSAGTRISDSD
jgi:hypothetical protein